MSVTDGRNAGGEVLVQIDGLVMRGSCDRHARYLDDVRERRREDLALALFKRAIRPGMTVVDVGAHLGHFTLPAAARAGARGRVFAFEPNPETVALLRANVAANGFADRVAVVPAGVGDGCGRRRLFLGETGTTSSLFDQGSNRCADVDSTTLDDALPADARVDVLKIDIEGGEVAALRGMRRTLAAAGPRLALFVECNPRALERAGTGAHELLDALAEQGFVPRCIDEQRRRLTDAAAAPHAEDFVNLLCTRRASQLAG